MQLQELQGSLNNFEKQATVDCGKHAQHSRKPADIRRKRKQELRALQHTNQLHPQEGAGWDPHSLGCISRHILASASSASRTPN